MADQQTAREVESEHIAKLGPSLGPVFHELWNDLAWLRVKWQEYHEMFGTKPERVELVNSTAGLFFRIVQDTLWGDILLHLCRLTDPPRSKRKTNLTLKALPYLITDPVLRSEVARLVHQADNATTFARDWRNRYLGHRDLALALNSGAKPLVPASRAQVSAALSAIHAVLNGISERLLDSTLASDVITPFTGAVTLLTLLRDGIEVRDARRERLRRGQPVAGDLDPRAV